MASWLTKMIGTPGAVPTTSRAQRSANGAQERRRSRLATVAMDTMPGGAEVDSQPSSGGLDSVPAEPPQNGLEATITSMSDMPAVRGVLTAVDSTNPALRIPKDLQDSVIALKLNHSQARIYYSPKALAAVTPYLGIIHSALAEAGLSSGGREYRASEEVIRSIRLSALDGVGRRGGSLGKANEGVALFTEWTRLAKDEKATDLHMRILDGGKAEVMIRVDGGLEPVPGSSNGIFSERDVLNAMKAGYEVLSDRHSNNHGTFSETSTLASMIDSNLGIPNLRLRFASVRGLYGPKVVCRLLPNTPGAKPMSFMEMGFAPSHIEIFRRSQRLQAGAIGQMGVTGSGKTTAAKTFVETHPGYGEMAMYQVADPIEYPMSHIHQIYVQRNLLTLSEAGKKDPYSEAIESLMRTDPDFVDVGEVRDKLSARAMANVAKSGHMSAFTLHVDSIEGALNRLTDPNIGLTRSELTTSRLIGMLCYQALSPLLCAHCKLDTAAILSRLKNSKDAREQEEEAYIKRVAKTLRDRFGVEPKALRFRNPDGCPHCRGRGTKGLTILAEMLMPDTQWLDLASQGKDREAMRYWRQEYSDRNLFSGNQDGKLVSEHAIYKAWMGHIDPREIERFTQLETMEVLSPKGVAN